MAVANTLDAIVICSVAFATRLFIALVLVTAAIHKLRTRLEFEGIVAQYQLMPKGSESLLSWLIPTFELLIGFALLALSQLGALLAAGLLAAYAFAIGINLRRGRQHIDCGCGGESTPLSAALVWRNLVLIALLLTSFLPAGGDQLSNSSLILSWTLAAGMGALYLCFNQLQVNAGTYRRLWLGEQQG